MTLSETTSLSSMIGANPRHAQRALGVLLIGLVVTSPRDVPSASAGPSDSEAAASPLRQAAWFVRCAETAHIRDYPGVTGPLGTSRARNEPWATP
jgi:hypothetical protein